MHCEHPNVLKYMIINNVEKRLNFYELLAHDGFNNRIAIKCLYEQF